MLDSIFSQKCSQHGPGSHSEVIDILLNAANFTMDSQKSAESCMSYEEFRKWCALLPSVRKFLGSLLMPSDPGSSFMVIQHFDVLNTRVFQF